MITLKSLNSLKPLSGLVLLIGPPASGKSTFATKLIAEHLIEEDSYISNDMIALDMFGVTHERGDKDGAIFAEQDRRIASLLQKGKAAVVDATNVTSEARKRVITIAETSKASITAFCFKPSDQTLLEQNGAREQPVPKKMVLTYAALMRNVESNQLHLEGIKTVYEVELDVDDL